MGVKLTLSDASGALLNSLKNRGNVIGGNKCILLTEFPKRERQENQRPKVLPLRLKYL